MSRPSVLSYGRRERPRRAVRVRGRRARWDEWLVIAVLLVIFTVTFCRYVRVRMLGWTGLVPHVMSTEDARKVLGPLFADGERIPPSLQIEEAEEESNKDGWARWFKLRVAPSDIPKMKTHADVALRAEANDADDWVLLPGAIYPPWWKPHDLPDPDLLTGTRRFYIFSAKTGVIYVAEFPD